MILLRKWKNKGLILKSNNYYFERMNKFLLFYFFILLMTTSFSFAQNDKSASEQIIYNTDTIVWFGADFSLFRLSNQKKVGQEAKLYEYIYAWNYGYMHSFSNVKLASLISKKKVINDKEFTTSSYKDQLPPIWIIGNEHTVSTSEIEGLLAKVETKNKGVGLICILETFYKGDPSKVDGYFVWFDIESRKILHVYKSEGSPHTSHVNSGGVEIFWYKEKPANKGMTGYWMQGMLSATLRFTFDYKKGIVTKEKEY